MAKDLETKQANRLSILGYHVDANKLTVSIDIQAQLLTDGGVKESSFSWPALLLEGATVQAVMADAGSRMVVQVLTASGISATVIAQVKAGLDANPALAAGAYYASTRDALYEQL